MEDQQILFSNAAHALAVPDKHRIMKNEVGIPILALFCILDNSHWLLFNSDFFLLSILIVVHLIP